MKKSKVMALTLAGAVAVTTLLTGTYAWQSISQLARNEANEEVNPGARLHDDFNGVASYSMATGTDAKVKNVYVENFTNASEGGQPVYARIRLEEYLEIGNGAGKQNDNHATPVASGTQLNQISTWKVYQWDNDPTFRDYIEIGTGGSTVYMPTYNRNRDSLEADINGTLAGKNGTAYDDYVKYVVKDQKIGVEIYDADDDTTDEAGAANVTTDQLIDAVIYTKADSGAGKKAGDLKITTSSSDITVTTASGTLTYPIMVETDSADPSKITAITVDLTNTVYTEADIRMEIIEASARHKAAATKRASVLTMQEWINNGSQLGAYWVCDTDGWAYWAQPINPGETTGCLINSVTLKPSANITGEYYYGLNVRAQFATAGDWGSGAFTATTATLQNAGGDGFYKDGITENAMRLLEKAAGAVKTVEVTTNDPVNEGMKGGDTATFSAEVTLGSVPVTDEVVTWTVEGKTSADTKIDRQPDGTAILTIGADETAYSITVVATSQKTGTDTKTIGSYIVPIKDFYTIEMIVEGDVVIAAQGANYSFSAKVSKRGKLNKNLGVTWSVEPLSGAFTDETSITSATGVLTVGETEEAEGLKIIATLNDDPTIKAEYEMSIKSKFEAIKEMPVGTTATVTIDGIDWYVLAKDNSDTEVLLWAADSIKTTDSTVITRQFEKSSVWYNSETNEASGMYDYLNNDFLETLVDLKKPGRIVEKTIKTRKSFNSGLNGEPEYYTSSSKIFLLSEADCFGVINKSLTGKEMVAQADDFTFGTSQLVTNEALLKCKSAGWYWLRSPRLMATALAGVTHTGVINDAYYTSLNGMIRPALWISLD